MPNKKARRVDPEEQQLQAEAARVLDGGEDEYGRVPGETRARGQVPELDALEQNAGENGDPADGSPVIMVRDGNETEVESADVAQHLKMGFARRDDPAAPVQPASE
jgi:hypothetical protein